MQQATLGCIKSDILWPLWPGGFHVDAVYDSRLIRLIENIHFVLFGQIPSAPGSNNLTDESNPFRTVIISPV